ncbi:MAG: MFS transporter [Chromatiales bacterium]|jgi:PPP family 3-phenylpropionic acid transporter
MPYWRLSGFYLFYFAVLGALVPYWGLYLKSLGFDALAIGQLVAIPMATKVIAPYLWGWLGDHLGHRMKIVQIASFLSVIIFTLIFVVQGFWWLALAMMLFSFFWNASLPQFEVVTLAYLGERVRQYSRIRVWGSVGFILTVIVLGRLIDVYGIAIVPAAIFLLYLSIWLSSMTLSDRNTEAGNLDQGPILAVLKKPTVIAFLLATLLMQFGHGAYYAFYSIYMEEIGHSKTLIGQLWALGVIAEVVVFLYMHRLLERFGAGNVLLASLLLAALRWVLIGWFAESLTVLLFAQLLHAATFGTFHASAIHLVYQYFRGRHQGRGQALYSSLSFGAGGALGSLLSGSLWESSGPLVTYSISAVVSLLAALIMWRWHDNSHQPQPQRESP